jgi:hypothetical protein
MKITYYLILSSLILATACKSAVSDNSNNNESATIRIEQVEAQTDHDIVLNGSEKWQIDKGMKEAIQAIEALVNQYNSDKLVDYQLLGDAIGVQTKKIIRTCTMTGQAHEELHKWLLPFLELKGALVMASSPEEGAAIVKHIKAELAVFNNYFN